MCFFFRCSIRCLFHALVFRLPLFCGSPGCPCWIAQFLLLYCFLSCAGQKVEEWSAVSKPQGTILSTRVSPHVKRVYKLKEKTPRDLPTSTVVVKFHQMEDFGGRRITY